MQVSQVLAKELSKISDVARIQAELLDIVESTPFPVWPGKAKNVQHIGVVQILNALFRERLQERGWRLEHRAHTGSVPDAYKVFGDVRVALEVQMANSARTAEDVQKFMEYVDHNVADLCCCILLDRRTANLCAGNVANIEHFQKRVDNLGWRYGGVPTYVVGLSQDSTRRVDVSAMGVAPADIEQGRNAHLCDLMAREILRDPANCRPSARLAAQPEQAPLF